MAHFWCDGGKNLPDAVFQLTDIVNQLYGQFYHIFVLQFKKVQIYPRFPDEIFRVGVGASYVNAFLGSQISPLSDKIVRMSTPVGC